jgi:subtilisin family serine protease
MRARSALLASLLAPVLVVAAAAPALADPPTYPPFYQLLQATSDCVNAEPAITPSDVCDGVQRQTLDPLLNPAGPEYIVVLHVPPLPGSTDGPTTPSSMADMASAQANSDPDIAALRAVQAGASLHYVFRYALRGYAAVLPPATYAAVAADSAVAYIEPVVSGGLAVDEPNPPWGLDRIDQRALPLNQTYSYTMTGAGVTAYVVDTGIRYTHTEFGGRAVPGYDAVDTGGGAVDCNGHGTHVSGTIGGTTYGVAKSVRLVGVRVVNCGGSGTTSQFVAGVDWLTGDHAAGSPAVANASLHYGPSQAVDDAVRGAINDGVAFAVAAANSNADACTDSPARVPEAMTVGATDQNDARASFSNWGACVDWFAPGVGILSAWDTGDTATATLSGTSMASPHTAGVAAQYLQANPGSSPAQVRDGVYAMTTKNVVTNAQSANAHLLFTDFRPHLAAVGVITLQDAGTGPAFTATGVYATDFNCALLTTGTVRVECTPKPGGAVVWDCVHFLLDAYAPAGYPQSGTGTVSGRISCDGPGTLATADVNGYGTAHADSLGLAMGTAGRVVCRAAGISGAANPTGSYKVVCNEPGVAKPFGPGY